MAKKCKYCFRTEHGPNGCTAPYPRSFFVKTYAVMGVAAALLVVTVVGGLLDILT